MPTLNALAEEALSIITTAFRENAPGSNIFVESTRTSIHVTVRPIVDNASSLELWFSRENGIYDVKVGSCLIFSDRILNLDEIRALANAVLDGAVYEETWRCGTRTYRWTGYFDVQGTRWTAKGIVPLNWLLGFLVSPGSFQHSVRQYSPARLKAE